MKSILAGLLFLLIALISLDGSIPELARARTVRDVIFQIGTLARSERPPLPDR
ncbi:MAG: hypothetical protein M3O35_13105 [Acidobacteriota bacterium]|nr:hypothetical protein [Acidobacteriota bacterium]